MYPLTDMTSLEREILTQKMLFEAKPPFIDEKVSVKRTFRLQSLFQSTLVDLYHI